MREKVLDRIGCSVAKLAVVHAHFKALHLASRGEEAGNTRLELPFRLLVFENGCHVFTLKRCLPAIPVLGADDQSQISLPFTFHHSLLTAALATQRCATRISPLYSLKASIFADLRYRAPFELGATWTREAAADLRILGSGSVMQVTRRDFSGLR